VVTVSFYRVELKLVRYSRSQNKAVRLDFAVRQVGICQRSPALERLCRLLCGKAPPFRTWATLTFSDFLSTWKAAPTEFRSHPREALFTCPSRGLKGCAARPYQPCRPIESCGWRMGGRRRSLLQKEWTARHPGKAEPFRTAGGTAAGGNQISSRDRQRAELGRHVLPLNWGLSRNAAG
jgi:hypothetical protein